MGDNIFYGVTERITVYGYIDSIVKNYAISNNYIFKGFGDANGDSALTIGDATVIQKQLAKLGTINSSQSFVADVNGDGEITIRDVTYIQMYLAKKIDEFPVTA